MRHSSSFWEISNHKQRLKLDYRYAGPQGLQAKTTVTSLVPACHNDAQTGSPVPMPVLSPSQPQALPHGFLFPNSGFLFTQSPRRDNLVLYPNRKDNF